MRKTGLIVLAGAALAGFAASANAGAVRSGFDASTLPANDDGSTGFVGFGLGTLNFYGSSYTGGYVNNNGNVTFTGAMSTFTPFPILTTGVPLLAPFFADVDTRGAGSGVTQYGAGMVGASPAWGVSWRDVGYYAFGTDKLNTFQLVIYDVQANGDFCFEFNYDKIEWETGSASGGTGGLGGSSARAGWSNGVSDAFEIAGSAVNGAFLDSNLVTGLIYRQLNSGVDGRFTFCVRNGTVVNPTIPLPTAGAMGLAGLAGMGVIRRRRA